MGQHEQRKVQFAPRRSIVSSLSEHKNIPALVDVITTSYLKRDGSVLVLVNRILQPEMLECMRFELPKKPFFTSWTQWIGAKLPEEPSVMHGYAPRIFISPLEPVEFSNNFWDLTGRFLPYVVSGSFPAFAGYARSGIMAVRISSALFYQIAHYLETPDPTEEDWLTRFRRLYGLL